MGKMLHYGESPLCHQAPSIKTLFQASLNSHVGKNFLSAEVERMQFREDILVPLCIHRAAKSNRKVTAKAK